MCIVNFVKLQMKKGRLIPRKEKCACHFPLTFRCHLESARHYVLRGLQSAISDPSVLQEFAILLGRPDLLARAELNQSFTANGYANSLASTAIQSSSRNGQEDVPMGCSTSTRMAVAVEAMLREIGEDPGREVGALFLAIILPFCSA